MAGDETPMERMERNLELMSKLMEGLLGSQIQNEANKTKAMVETADSNKKKYDDRGIKTELLEFNGKEDPDEVQGWIQHTENVFDLKGIEDEQAYKFVAIKLTKHASIWLESLKKERAKAMKAKIKTWSKLKKHFVKRFIPPDYEQTKYTRMTKLVQGSSSVEDYIREFDKLTLLCEVEEREAQRIARFLHGLNSDVSDVVELQGCLTFREAKDKAVIVSKQLQRRVEATSKPRYTPSKPWNTKDVSKGEGSKTTSKDKDKQMVVYEDKQKSKNKPWIDQFKKNPPDPKLSRQCFKCKGFGHYSHECPTARVLSVMEVEEYVLYNKFVNSGELSLE